MISYKEKMNNVSARNNRLEIIDKHLEKRLTQVAAAHSIGISERHFRRLLKEFKQQGIDGLISKRRGSASNNKLAEQIRLKALQPIASMTTISVIGRFF